MSGTSAPVIKRAPAKTLTGRANDVRLLKRDVAMKHL